jgi:ribose-phosphate pyrophosphokinase
MSTPLIVALPGNEALAARLVRGLDGELATVEFRRFPDGESYVRFHTPAAGRSVVLACTLDRPDEKFLALSFAAGTARELGAARVGLVAPYLAYLRQDKRFKPGEALTSALFARMLSSAFDWLVTIDPHLHRLSTLDAIYTIPTGTLHAAPLIAQWIAKHVSLPLLIGPDVESEQWVGAIAAECRAPHIVLGKRRRGDRAVEISVPDIGRWSDRTPVLIDDIISSAHTMIETLSQLSKLGMKPAICIGVHAVFGYKAFDALRAAGPARIVTVNTIFHETNEIDVSPLLVEAVRSKLEATARCS